MSEDRLTDADDRPWRIEIPDSELAIDVNAAYPTTDQKLPGWTVLKDHRHKIVAMVRDDARPVLYVDEGSETAGG